MFFTLIFEGKPSKTTNNVVDENKKYLKKRDVTGQICINGKE